MTRSPKVPETNKPTVTESSPRLQYTLADLLAGSDDFEPRSDEDRAWINALAVGRELL